MTSGRRPILLLLPSLAITLLLFGGGLAAGVLQALGHVPGQGFAGLNISHFSAVLADPDFLQNLVLTLHIALTSTVIAAVFSTGLALALVHLAAKNRLVFFILQIPLTVPHLAVAVAFLLLLAPSGLLSRLLLATGFIDTTAAFPLLVHDSLAVSIILVYVWKEIPFLTLMLLSVLKNQGTELLEVGATLNAGKFRRFIHITLPLLTPALTGGCLIVFAFTFGAFEVPYLLGRTYPVPLPVWAFQNYSDVDLLARPEGIALGLIIAAIIIGLLAAAQTLLKAGTRERIF